MPKSNHRSEAYRRLMGIVDDMLCLCIEAASPAERRALLDEVLAQQVLDVLMKEPSSMLH